MVRLLVENFTGQRIDGLGRLVRKRLLDWEPTHIYKARKKIVKAVLKELGASRNTELTHKMEQAVAALFKCYAGNLALRFGNSNKGYPKLFERPELFPGRMAEAASARDLIGTIRVEKPWLNNLPRLMFVSDMGDALSPTVPFEFLRQEIISVVASSAGQRHTWLWLTKLPKRMVQFWEWLRAQNINWPTNLVPMTSITSSETVYRARVLTQMDVALRGLSVEPLWESVQLPLVGISWVIVGGESGPYAEPFHIEWARDVRRQCKQHGIAFFIKQLGQNPYANGHPLKLQHEHGGEWAEWSQDLRIREFPVRFYRGTNV